MSSVLKVYFLNIYSIYFSNCNLCSAATVPVSNNKRNNTIENTHHRADCESCYSEPPDPMTNVSNLEAASLYFTDGERLIDFVLVWKGDEDDDPKQIESKREKRAIFEENLFTEGLELEKESFELLHFTKIHVTIEVLRRYSEILKLRMPMKDVSLERPLLLNKMLSLRISKFTIPVFVQNSRTKSIQSHFECCTLFFTQGQII